MNLEDGATEKSFLLGGMKFKTKVTTEWGISSISAQSALAKHWSTLQSNDQIVCDGKIYFLASGLKGQLDVRVY